MRSTLSDDQLLAAYAEKGDQLAFEQLVRRHKDRVYGFIMGMVRDTELANDLFQDTFVKVIDVMHRRRTHYSPQGRFVGWILMIARNVVFDYKRSRNKWKDVAGDNEEYWEQLPDENHTPDDLLYFKERSQWLDDCIQSLPPSQREVVLLRQDAELTFREISEITGVSINTALGRMRYALINLRAMIDKQSQSYAPPGSDIGCNSYSTTTHA
ncbi:MAG: sigma-70 family RNA polymerase sigma factor [Bacteroidetes bacterium]|nr:sigma-70 family RNA polymerase sigma factor [Bacteroidota bacterium]MCY4233721.1 sigma-70 family RNA polymerase sigma factor [Bacteroidota bacterium]